MLNIKQMLDTASILLEQQGGIRDAAARGTLRGGSGGWMGEDCQFCAGTCPRKAWARKEGYVLEDNTEKQGMFQAGRNSEDAIVELLQLVWTGDIKREEEIPISWQTSNGTSVTGRPDVVLLDATGTPVHGLELKLCSSMWSMLETLQSPKTEHLIQALHYSTQLKLPWSIVYANRTNWTFNSDFQLKKVPAKGEPGSEYINYKERTKTIVDKKTKQKRVIEFVEGKDINPFHQVYPIQSNYNGEVEVQIGEVWYPSFVSWEGIERFYEFVSKMDATQKVGPVPTQVSFLGVEKNWKICAYCSLEKECGGRDMPLDKFRSLCEVQHQLVLDAQNEKLAQLNTTAKK